MKPIVDNSIYFSTYIDQALNQDLFDSLEDNRKQLLQFIDHLPQDKIDYQYADGKWTIKQVIRHIIDVERILSVRALMLARGEQQELMAFDENDYADQSGHDNDTLDGLKSEFINVRQSTQDLFNSFDSKMLKKNGMANGLAISVSLIGWLISGHTTHHINIMNERYLNY